MVLVIGTVFVDLVGFAIVLPLLPSYGARYTRSDLAIGILVASYSLVQLLLAPWWGRLSDRIGRRPVVLVGLVGSSLSYLLFAWAGSFTLLLVSRIVAGATGATVSVAQASLADGTPPERRSHKDFYIGLFQHPQPEADIRGCQRRSAQLDSPGRDLLRCEPPIAL